jgi:hypothetical protein
MAIALEALGVATSREVGEWVERVGHAELLERARLVSVVESSSLDAPSGALPPTPASSRPADGEPLGPVTSLTSYEPQATDLSPPRRFRRGLVALVALGVAFVGLVALLLVRRASVRATTVVEPVPSPVTLAASEPVVVSAEASPPLAVSVSERPAGSEAKPGAAASKAPASTRPRPQAKRPTAHCAPYVIDSNGRKQFNEECLR